MAACMPQRVLQVTGSLGLGGAEAMITSLHGSLDRERIQFDYLVFKPSQEGHEARVLEMGGRIIRANPPSRRRWNQFVRHVAHLIEHNGPYVAVHSHINFASAPVLVGAAQAGVTRRVAHAHISGTSRRGLASTAYRHLMRNVIIRVATDLVGCGDLAGRYVFGRRWENEGKVIKNAVEVERFAKAPSVSGLRASLGVPPGGLLLGSIARLDRQKNHAFLMQLVGHPQMRAHGVHLLLVGEGRLKAEIEHKVVELGIEDRVHMVGARKDVPELMKSMDYLVLPSLYEGLPVVLVEAQAAGLPVLASDHVTREVDLGLGLVEFLQLDVEEWVNRLTFGKPRIPTPDEAYSALYSRGYAVESSARKLLEIYGLGRP